MTELSPSPAPIYANGAVVEAHLVHLQRANRLAIHQWESIGGRMCQFPQDTLDELTGPFAPNKRKVQQSSLTLLPGRPGISVIPYQVQKNHSPGLGYAIDMSHSDTLVGPTVLRACPHNLSSGTNALEKDLNLAQENDIPALDEFYGQQQWADSDMRKLMRGPDSRKYSEFQLDALGEYLSRELPTGHPRRFEHNEVVAAVGKEHIAAIYMPIFGYDNPGELEVRKPYIELKAAIAGLQHIKEGIDVPVMFYNVTPPNQGKMTYFAQGKQMLTEKALGALSELKLKITYDRKTDPWLWGVREAAEELLGKEAVADTLKYERERPRVKRFTEAELNKRQQDGRSLI